MGSLHQKLNNSYGWYRKWHEHPRHQHGHWFAFLSFALLMTALISSQALGLYVSNTPRANAQTNLPGPNHSMLLGYYYAIADNSPPMYGDFLDEVKGYNNAQVLVVGRWIRGGTSNDTAGLDAAMSRLVATGQRIIFLAPSDASDPRFNVALDVAKNYWSSIDYFSIYDEPDVSGMSQSQLNSGLQAAKDAISAKGLFQKPIMVNFTRPQILTQNLWQASNIDVVSFEAYADPSRQNENNLATNLLNEVNQAKAVIGNKQMMIVVQGYGRNYCPATSSTLCWSNLTSLQSIQTTAYLAAYNDPNVIGLTIFSYGRSSGTKDLVDNHGGQCIKTEHQRIWGAINGSNQPAPVACTGPTPTPTPSTLATPTDATSGWRDQLAFNSNNNTWLIVSDDYSVRGSNPQGVIWGRIMNDNANPVTGQFNISVKGNNLGPKVAYDPKSDTYLVIWVDLDNAGGNIFGRFINSDGSFGGNPFAIPRDPNDNIYFFYSNSVLRYDSVNDRFVFVWEDRTANSGTINIRLRTIDPNGNAGSTVVVLNQSSGIPSGPALAINEQGNEYCVVLQCYNGFCDLGTGTTEQTVAVVRIDASNMSVGPINTLINGGGVSIAYNNQANEYLVTWQNNGPQIRGEFLKSCGASSASPFSIMSNVGAAITAYNSASNTYAVIGQDQNDGNNTFTQINAAGVNLLQGYVFTGGTQGNFSPVVEANKNTGTYGAVSSLDLTLTRFASPLGIGGIIVTPTPTTTTTPTPTGIGGSPTPTPEPSYGFGPPFGPTQTIFGATSAYPLGTLIEQFFVYALYLLGFSVFIMLVWAGFLWLTSAGNPAMISSAKSKIWNAIIGAVIFISGFAILYTINPGLIKGSFSLGGLSVTGASGQSVRLIGTGDIEIASSITSGCDLMGESRDFASITCPYEISGAFGLTADPILDSQDAQADQQVGAVSIQAGGNRGQGRKVVVLDTGYNYNHPELSSSYLGGKDFANNDTDPVDDNGHGSHVAGIITDDGINPNSLGVAPDAGVIAGKVLSANGSGYASNIINGIYWAINGPDGIYGTADDFNPDVINISIGSTTKTYNTICDSAETLFSNAINYANSHGVLVVASSGNSGTSGVTLPGCINNAFTVGAVDNSDNIASFSGRGGAVDVAAPGVSIYSSVLGSGYARYTGTSQAAPIVSGIALLIKAAHPEYSVTDLKNAIISTVKDLGAAGWDSSFGWGRVTANGAGTGTSATARVITSLSPTTVSRGTTITISGTNLSNTVQAFDSSRARYTTLGVLNSSATQVTWIVPAIPGGNYTLRVGPTLTDYSNEVPFTITGGTSVSPTPTPSVPPNPLPIPCTGLCGSIWPDPVSCAKGVVASNPNCDITINFRTLNVYESLIGKTTSSALIIKRNGVTWRTIPCNASACNVIAGRQIESNPAEGTYTYTLNLGSNGTQLATTTATVYSLGTLTSSWSSCVKGLIVTNPNCDITINYSSTGVAAGTASLVLKKNGINWQNIAALNSGTFTDTNPSIGLYTYTLNDNVDGSRLARVNVSIRDRLISSLSPASAKAGTTVTFNGSNLASALEVARGYFTVQLFDKDRNRYTTTGSVNPNNTTGTWTALSLPPGNYTVRVGPDLIDTSDEVPFTILP